MAKKENTKGKASEKTLSEGEFRDLIAYAGSLQRFDETKDGRGLYSSVLDSLSLDEGISIPVIYQVAEELDIPQSYIDRALRIKHPSIEDVLRDIKRHGAIPTIKNIAKAYRGVLLSDLLSLPTTDRFDAHGTIEDHPDIHFNRVIEKEETTGFFRKKLEISRSYENLAHFDFTGDGCIGMPKGKFELEITLQDPLFLMVCGENLERLNNEFKDLMCDYHIRHDY